MNYLWRLMNYLTTRSEHRNTIKALNKLSDRELKDISLNRADIDRMVWLEEDKTMRGRG
jgi:uncharacterized protein YjiS (DUF1127 family)